MIRALLFVLCLVFLSLDSRAQSVDWVYESGPANVYSSPHLTDLNQDGILDIVIGGGIESSVDLNWDIILNYSDYGVMAIDGANGEELWKVESNDQIFTSAVFVDITGDTIPDAFLGGRNANLMAINGATGEIVWEFFPENDTTDPGDSDIYQFYTPQVIRDVDYDQIPDLLVINGGDKLAASFEEDRPAGKLMIISSATGTMLASATVPDERESYMSPLVYQPYRNGETFVVFGTGGETVGGNLYIANMQEVLSGDLSDAIVLASDEDKGFIAPPTLADLTGDNIYDIVVNSFGGRVIAVDGRSHQTIFDTRVEGSETSASPTLGHFTEDDVPDIFATFGVGVAPSFSAFRHVMINGATGAIEWSEDSGLTQFGTANAVDINSDGTDEVLYIINQVEDGTFVHEMIQVDFTTNTTSSFLAPTDGTVIFSTPWVGDMDNDQFLDMVYVHNTDGSSFGSTDGVSIKKLSLLAPSSITVAWGCYLGEDYDAVYSNSKGDCFDSPEYGFLNSTTSLMCIGDSNGEAICTASGCPCQTSTCEYLWENGDTTKHAYNLDAGIHYVTVTHEDGCVMVTRAKVNEPAPVEVNAIAPTCVGNADATASIVNTNFNAALYSYKWPNEDTTLTVSGLMPGIYDLTVTHQECEDIVSFEIPEALPIQLEASVEDAPCGTGDGGSVQLTASGGNGNFVYQIDGEQFQGDIATDLAPGEYTVSVLDTNGCEGEAQIVNVQAPEPLIIAADAFDALCFGEASGSIGLSGLGGTGALSFLIDGEEVVGEVAMDLSAGTYMVGVMDENSCLTEEMVEVGEPQEFTALTNESNLSCFGANDGSVDAVLAGGTPPYRWVKDGEISGPTSSANISFSLLEAGEITVGFLDANDCMIEYSTELTQPDSLYVIVQVSANESVAGAADGIASLNAQGGVPPYVYVWNDPAEQTDYAAFNLPGGTYEVVVTDDTGCSVNATVVIETISGVNVENAEQIGLEVYPNPGNGLLNLEFEAQKSDMSWTIVSLAGRQLANGTIKAGSATARLDLRDLAGGMYFVELQIDDTQILKKIVIE